MLDFLKPTLTNVGSLLPKYDAGAYRNNVFFSGMKILQDSKTD
jgi:hypothetical protein